MEKVEQGRDEREQQDTSAEPELRVPGRRGEREAQPALPAHDPGAPGPQTDGAVSAGVWEADASMMTALGLDPSQGPQRAPGAPAIDATAVTTNGGKPPGGGGTAVDAPMMRAMGLGGGGAPGAAGGTDGDQALEGIATPPKGQTQGRVTPETAKPLEAKKQQIAKGPGAAPAADKGAAAGASSAAAPAPATPASATKAPVVTAPTTSPQPHRPSPGAGGGGGGSATATAGQTHLPAPQGEVPPPDAPGNSSPQGPVQRPPGDDGSVEGMIYTLGHSRDAGARKRAAEALGKLRAAAARPALERAAHDPDPVVAAAASAALKQLGSAAK